MLISTNSLCVLLLFVVVSWICPMVESWLYRSNCRQVIRQLQRLQQAKGFGTQQFQINSPMKRAPLRPGKLSARREIPPHIKVPDYAFDGIPKQKEASTISPTPTADIEKMRVACKFAREVLDAAIWSVYNGTAKTTDDIDKIVHEETIRRNAYPSPLNYQRFPKSCCTSLNEVMCHGIPDNTPLMDGDILNIDVTVFWDGVHGDCSETILVGQNTSPAIKHLVRTAYSAWQAAIDICRPGASYSEIGNIIEAIVVPEGYSVARDFAGHG